MILRLEIEVEIEPDDGDSVGLDIHRDTLLKWLKECADLVDCDTMPEVPGLLAFMSVRAFRLE